MTATGDDAVLDVVHDDVGWPSWPARRRSPPPDRPATFVLET